MAHVSSHPPTLEGKPGSQGDTPAPQQQVSPELQLLEQAFNALTIEASNKGDSSRVAEVAAAREAVLQGRLPECWHCELGEPHPEQCLRTVVQHVIWLPAMTQKDVEEIRDEEDSIFVPWDLTPLPEDEQLPP